MKLNVHLLQAQAFLIQNEILNKVQYYACKKLGHISKDCPNHYAMGEPLSRRVTFADGKSTDCANIV